MSPTTEATLEQRLAALVADRRWESSGSLRGCSAAEGHAIELDMVPPDRKLVMRITEGSAETPLYYLKTEGYESGSFHMLNGSTETDTVYTVEAIANTEDGLRISVGGQNFTYVDSLDGLEFEIVDKDPVELANDRIKRVDTTALSHYGLNRATIERARTEAARALEALETLEEFAPESPLRYSIDCTGIQAAIYRDGALGPLQGFGRLREPSVYGRFHGNRFAVIADWLMLVDDERGLAVCPTFDLDERIACGFGPIEVVDRTDQVRDPANDDLEVSLAAATS